MYAYSLRFHPSDLHCACGTQHQSYYIILWKTFYLQLRQALLTKPEVVVPAVYQSLPRVVGPYTLSNLCQRLKSSPVFSDHVIVKLSCDQTGSSQNGGLTTCGFAFSMNTPVKRLKIECFVCNTPNNTCICLHGIYALYDWSPYKK